MYTSKKGEIDKFFLYTTMVLVGFGVLAFISAAFGIYAKSQEKFFSILFSQLVLGLGLGLLVAYFTSKVNYKFWRKHSLVFFIISIVACLLVFVPGIGVLYNGARRWISIGPISFQPAEFLKIAVILYLSAWLSFVRNKPKNFWWSLVPLVAILGVAGIILGFQPDTKSFILIVAASLVMIFVSGVSFKYIGIAVALMAATLALMVLFRPYVADRIKTYVDPSSDPLGSSWQIDNSMIAIGSGGFFGRGYGQSIQKFTYLPEPHGDSIFAVIGEEMGFLGTTFLVLLYAAFGLRGFKIAMMAPDTYSRFLVVGIIGLLLSQSFLNILSMTGLFPLTGVPLVFVSHGGTSLLFSFFAVGIVMNVSRYTKITSLV